MQVILDVAQGAESELANRCVFGRPSSAPKAKVLVGGEWCFALLDVRFVPRVNAGEKASLIGRFNKLPGF